MLAAGVQTGGKSLRSLNRFFLLLTISILNLALSASVEATSSCRSGNRWPVEKRARHAELVFHALAVENYPAIDVENPPEKGFRYTAQFWLISVYKGDQQLAKYLNLEETLTNGIYDIHDRRVNVTRFYRPNATATPNCWKPVTSQKYYVIFAEMRDDHLAAKDDDTLGAYADWTEKNEQKAWRGVGWEQWSEWAACSASCGEGSQIRSRYCLLQDGCRGFNREKRTCNTFPCEGSVSPLDVDESKFFHPSRAQWTRVPGRETAWRLRPNSYLWLPAAQLPFPPANFRRHFAILVTLRLDPKAKAEGTVFSLRSRRQQDSYLSVELGGAEAIKVVHSGRNGTQTILVPASLADGNWHYLALGIQDDSSVRSYVDCRWVSTDILRRNELDTPDDADLVIGYLFSGDLEQLVIVPDPRAVSQQCSATKQPSLDPLLEATRPRRPSASFVRNALLATNEFSSVNSEMTEATLKKISPTIAPPSDSDSSSWQDLDTDLAEEGSGLHPESTDQYEVEWSEWSQCVSARGEACASGGGGGHQTRSSRCVDTGGWLELCLESGAERTQTRACTLPPCNYTTTITHNNGRCGECLNGGVCAGAGAGAGGGKRRPCRCPVGAGGWHCEHFSCHPRCLNGGSCVALHTCSCTALYQGTHCQTPICDPPCENGGQCVAPQQCLCPASTFGNYCQNFTCRGGCLNGGLCVGPDLCECQNNSTGRRCAQPVCDPPCENGATCAAGNICHCGPHTSGTRCQTKKCDYRPVQEPYTRGYRRLVKKHLQAKCETWTWKTCIRTLPEYQTVYKTYYRTVYKCVDQL